MGNADAGAQKFPLKVGVA